MNTNKLESYFTAIITFCLAACFLIVYAISEGVQEPGDGIQHYLIAKYSWQHLALLIDHWGKPVFTILSSPFAQIGFIGMVFFNVILFCCTIYLLYKIASYFNLKIKWIIPFVLFFSPVYYNMVIAGMTEILFAFVATLSLYLILQKKYSLAAIVFSFIIYTRPEGLVIFPFYLFFFLIKSPKNTPLLFTGLIFFGLVGFAYYDSFFWLFTKTPYRGAKEIYGSGELLHFVRKNQEIFGALFSILLGLGSVLIIKNTIKEWIEKKQFFNTSLLPWWLLIFAPIAAIVFTHSYLWWQGLKGSYGLVRVLATTVPFVSLIVCYFLSFLTKKINIKWLTVLASFFVIVSGYTWNKHIQIPISINKIDKTLTEAGDWIKKNKTGKVCYLHPYLAYSGNLNPFDEKKTMLLWSVNKKTPSKSLSKNDLIVWDAHFGPNEGRLTLETLKADKKLELVKFFAPKERTTVLGGRDFGIYIFKVKKKENHTNFYTKKTEILPDIKQPLVIQPKDEFITLYEYSTPSNTKILTTIAVNFKLNIPKHHAKEDLHLVIKSVNSKKQDTYYNSYVYDTSNTILNINEQVSIPKLNTQTINIYLWNNGKKTYTVSDLNINIKSK